MCPRAWSDVMKSRRETLLSFVYATRPLTQRVLGRPGIPVRESLALHPGFCAGSRNGGDLPTLAHHKLVRGRDGLLARAAIQRCLRSNAEGLGLVKRASRRCASPCRFPFGRRPSAGSLRGKAAPEVPRGRPDGIVGSSGRNGGNGTPTPGCTFWIATPKSWRSPASPYR